jgi:hypothetical protein
VTGASDTLDPIATAKAEIAGSKNLIASVADDLNQQERWLAQYRVAELRRARRVKFREVLYWLEFRRQRLTRRLRQYALTTLHLGRSAAAFLWRTAVALSVVLSRTAVACYDWLRPRVYALSLALAALLTALLAWTLVRARARARAAAQGASLAAKWIAHQTLILAAILRRWLLAAWAWTQVTATALARASLASAVIGASWIAATLRTGALALRRELTRLARLAAWTNKKAGHFSRASLATASLGFSWASTDKRPSDHAHGALAPRRCTALVSFEPQRARLPALRAG